VKRGVLVVFAVAFLVRGGVLASGMVPAAWIEPETRSEVGRVARSLAESGRYADGYAVPTGPTAHPLPLYTGTLGLLYRFLGMTYAAGVVRCLLGIALYSAMFAAIPWFAVRIGLGLRAGLLGGLAGALFPRFGAAEVLGWSGDEPLAALAMALLMGALARRWGVGRCDPRGAVAIGLGFGIAFHAAPALLLVFFGSLLFEALRCKDRARWRSLAAYLLGAALACAPWTARNLATFGEWFFLRSNVGLELRIAYHEGALPDMESMDLRRGGPERHPGVDREEAQEVRDLGEMEYMRRARREALDWIAAHPGESARLAGVRFLLFWFGPFAWFLTLLAALGAWHVLPNRSAAERAAVLIPLAAYPLVYYGVTHMVRYTVPVGWILLLLAGAEADHWIRRAESP
jgi:hypothetical protein